ncbi:hypothetical protein FQA39_LY16868 [Lamprigera yunnana]|nr:hypothetical protein FQA39_LY16868 [Lamprigera yunnana]
MSETLELKRRQFIPQKSTVAIRKTHAVSVRKAHKCYGSKKHPIVILNDLNMTVPKGTIYGLLGSSGCGKTTLLNCVVGRQKFDSGELWVLGGHPGTRGSGLPGPRIGYMPQDVALYSEFSITETMKYFGWISKMSSSKIQERLQFLVELLNLPDVDRKIKNLSGGQQRRVSFAAALLHEPELLILDEPTVGLDPLLRETIWRHLVEITKDGDVTVVLTTHYIEETRHAHLIGLMRSGYIMAEESPSKILSRFETDTLEDAFLKLSIMQNMGRRRRSMAAQAVTSTVTIPSGIINQAMILEEQDSQTEISAEFGDGISKKDTKRRFSLVPDQKPLEFPTPPTESRELKITDYLLHLDPMRMKALIWKNFLWMWHNFAIMMTILALPIVQFTIFYITIGHPPTHLKVALVNYESNDTNCDLMSCNNSILSCVFLGYLEDKKINLIRYSSESAALESVDRGVTYASIVIKSNYTSALQSRFKKWRHADQWDLLYSTINVYRDVSVHDIANFLKLYLYESFGLFISDYFEACELNRDSLKVPFKMYDPIYGSKTTEYTEFAAPGAILVIAFFLSAGLTAVAMLIERNEGILERSLVLGVTAVELLTSHVISEFVLVIVQIITVIACGLYIFQMAMNGSLLLLLVFTISTGFCGMWYGFSLSCTCEKETTAAYILMGSFLPMLLVCGIVWPIEGMNYVLQLFSYILPLTKPVETMRSIMQRGSGIDDSTVYGGFITIGLWTLVFLIISVLVLKYCTFFYNFNYNGGLFDESDWFYHKKSCNSSPDDLGTILKRPCYNFYRVGVACCRFRLNQYSRFLHLHRRPCNLLIGILLKRATSTTVAASKDDGLILCNYSGHVFRTNFIFELSNSMDPEGPQPKFYHKFWKAITCENVTTLPILKDGIKECIHKEQIKRENFQCLEISRSTVDYLGADFHSGIGHLKKIKVIYSSVMDVPVRAFEKFHSLCELYLESSTINGINKQSFNGLSNLKYLCLTECKIDKLPEGLFDGLVALENLNLQNNSLESIPEKLFAKSSSLKLLCLSDNKIESLPPNGFAALGELKLLRLENNKIRSLNQSGFSGLKSLEELVLFGNLIASVDNGAFDEVPELQVLNLSNNNLSILPDDAFSKLEMLINLNLSRNKLSTLPHGLLKNLQRIETIDLQNNSITSLPSGFLCDSSCLKNLNLSNNIIKHIPDGVFANAVALSVLNLENNRIEYITGDCFDFLPNLNELNLGNNSIMKIFPNAFKSMTSLGVLNLEDNMINGLVHNVFNGLVNLTLLNIKGNKITDLPIQLFKDLSKLTDLYLNENDISELNSGVFNGLENLSKLQIHKNKFSSIKSGTFKDLNKVDSLFLGKNHLGILESGVFDGLSNLSYLSVEHNQIETFEDNCFIGLPNLEILCLSHNTLVDLPKNLFIEMTNLRYLYLKNTNLSVLHSGIFLGLNHLLQLHLVHNKISNIESGAFEGLSGLQFLSLYQNDIGELESGVFLGLDSLNYLELGNNQIKQITPETLQAVPKLKNLRLAGNKLTLANDTFANCPQLLHLDLSDNNIDNLPADVFKPLQNLNVLHFCRNNVETLTSDSFADMAGLKFLYLQNNNIKTIEPGAFKTLESLLELYLDDNKVTTLETGCFEGLNAMCTLQVENNCIENLNAEIFSELPALKFASFEGNPLSEEIFSDIKTKYSERTTQTYTTCC